MGTISNDNLNDFLGEVREKAKGEEKLLEQFERCFLNTLETTVKMKEDGTVYVITGDIPAMWLRDSTAQIRPFLFPAKQNGEIQKMIAGLVKRQFNYICLDPYANAFNEGPTGACWEKDDPDQSPWVWERKFEVDSLCYPIQLAWMLWKNTGCTEQFEGNFRTGARKILNVFCTEQNHEHHSAYRFVREDSFYTDTLSREGRGACVKPDIGMVWSGFRPSDDACTYGYLIPSNMFAVVVLGYLEEISEKVLYDKTLAKDAGNLREQIHTSIEEYGRTRTEAFGTVYAYEADGYGMYNLMDDANVPSLLSLPWLGWCDKEDPLYQNTRRFILSKRNPFYFQGKWAKGIGSPHTPKDYIWHIGLTMQGLTSGDPEERKMLLETLLATDSDCEVMHEGFCCDDPSRFTREWFAWANSLFALYVLDLKEDGTL